MSARCFVGLYEKAPDGGMMASWGCGVFARLRREDVTERDRLRRWMAPCLLERCAEGDDDGGAGRVRGVRKSRAEGWLVKGSELWVK
jgi:hypothetical protein